jgi:hypothetical protein
LATLGPNRQIEPPADDAHILEGEVEQ